MPANIPWSERFAQLFASVWTLFGGSPAQQCEANSYAALGLSFAVGLLVGSILTTALWSCSSAGVKSVGMEDGTGDAKTRERVQGTNVPQELVLGGQSNGFGVHSEVQLKSSPRHSAETAAIVSEVRRNSAHKRAEILESPVSTLRKRHVHKNAGAGGEDEDEKTSAKERLKELHLRRILNEKRKPSPSSPSEPAHGGVIKQVSRSGIGRGVWQGPAR